jgi:N-acetyl-gamma-glutamyl-phosphate reductase
MSARIFIDGEAGTTGLQIRARLAGRPDVTVVSLDHARRKDRAARAALLNEVDLVMLCLPDDAAREAVAMIENPTVRVIDASTAHRIADGWIYGFPEMDTVQPSRIAAARRVANPGCYPTGAIALLRPLIAAGLVPANFPITVNAVSGYSGGGKPLISRYEDPQAADRLDSPFWVYGLGLEHKHVPELQQHALLRIRPLFVPSVGRFAQGMIVQIPLQLWALPGAPRVADVHSALDAAYRDQPFVSVAPLDESARLERLEATTLNGTNEMKLHCFGSDTRQQVVLAAVLDNLGKGASGAAVQNMNLMLGLDPRAGLV